MSRRAIALMNPRRILRDDMFDDFFQTISPWTNVSMSYSLDMYETDNAVIVELEAPNFKPEDVDIEMEDNLLTISGTVSEEKKQEKDQRKYHVVEIRQESFVRSVTLPVKVKSEDAEAEFKDGIIRVTLPKAEEVKPKKVSIKKSE